MTYRCPLGDLLPSKTDPEELEEIKAQGWCEHGILVVNVDDPRLSWSDREFLRQIGNRLYRQ